MQSQTQLVGRFLSKSKHNGKIRKLATTQLNSHRYRKRPVFIKADNAKKKHLNQTTK